MEVPFSKMMMPTFVMISNPIHVISLQNYFKHRNAPPTTNKGPSLGETFLVIGYICFNTVLLRIYCNEIDFNVSK